jgi:hypothetical protein
MAETRVPATWQPLRLWPGVVAAIAVCLLRYVAPFVLPDGSLVGLLGAMAGAAAVLIWWMFFSRAPWVERLGAIAVLAIAFFVTKPFLHRSIATGMMGMMYGVYALPAVVAPVFVAWAVLTRRFSNSIRRVTMVVAIFLACAVWMLLRTDGIIGSGAQLAWRWSPTAEERLLARGDERLDTVPALKHAEPVPVPVAPTADEPKASASAEPPAAP